MLCDTVNSSDIVSSVRYNPMGEEILNTVPGLVKGKPGIAPPGALTIGRSRSGA
jgi:hypothetical protein